MLSLLRGRPGKTVDLGSGDGRIVRTVCWEYLCYNLFYERASASLGPDSLGPQVLAAHRCGLRPSVGYELNPWLVGLARLRAWRAGCVGSVRFHREDLWKVTQGPWTPSDPTPDLHASSSGLAALLTVPSASVTWRAGAGPWKLW